MTEANANAVGASGSVWENILGNVNNLFDKGLDVYTAAVGKVKAIKSINQETTKTKPLDEMTLEELGNVKVQPAPGGISTKWIFIGGLIVASVVFVLLKGKRK